MWRWSNIKFQMELKEDISNLSTSKFDQSSGNSIKEHFCNDFY